MGRSKELAPREEDAHIFEVVRRKLAYQLKQAPLLTESGTDESDVEEEVCSKVSTQW